MRVRVQFFATLRDRAGASEIELCLPDAATVRDALAQLVAQRPGLAPEVSADGLSDSVNVFLNGKNVMALDGLSTPLKDGDVINLFPPLGGG